MTLTEEQCIVLEELLRLLQDAKIVLKSTMSNIEQSLAIARAINNAWSGAQLSRIIEASVDPRNKEVAVHHVCNPHSKGVDIIRLPLSLLYTESQVH